MRNCPTVHDLDIFARTLYGESEPNNVLDAEAIAWVVLNRVDLPNWPDTVAEVCQQPWQFSTWNVGDPNRERILKARGDWFNRCREIAVYAANGCFPDPTSRSTHYYATWVNEPRWAKGKTPVYEVAHRGEGRTDFITTSTPSRRSCDDPRRVLPDNLQRALLHRLRRARRG